SQISTRMISGPTLQMHSNGITYSLSYPNRPPSLPGPGTTIAWTQPFFISTTRSATQPRRLQFTVLMTSFSLRSQSLILFPSRYPESCGAERPLSLWTKKTHTPVLSPAYASFLLLLHVKIHYRFITFSLSNAFAITAVKMPPSTNVITRVTPYCAIVTSDVRIPFKASAVL